MSLHVHFKVKVCINHATKFASIMQTYESGGGEIAEENPGYLVYAPFKFWPNKKVLIRKRWRIGKTRDNRRSTGIKQRWQENNKIGHKENFFFESRMKATLNKYNRLE